MSVSPNGRPLLGLHPTKVSISNSEIQTFKECRRKWWLAYYRGLQRKQRSMVGPLPLGTRVHAALEAYYAHNEDLLATYAALVGEDRILFLQTPGAADEAQTKKFNSEAELGRIILEGYLEWIADENDDATYETVATEGTLSYEPEEFGGQVSIIGKYDLLRRNKFNEFLELWDHKTAASFDTYYKYAMMSEQLMLYINLLRKMTGGELIVDGGVYNLVKKNKRSASAKPPFYKRLHIRFGDKQLASAWTRTIGTVSDIMNTREQLDAGEDHLLVAYPTPQDSCSWKCEFFHGCTMFDDGSAAEEWLDHGFEQGDPYARYRTENPQ